MAWDKVTSGQQIKQTPIHRAGFINDTIDVVNAHKEGRLQRPAEADSANASRVRVQIRNQTGSNLVVGQVVQLGPLLLSSLSQDHPWFEGNMVANPASDRLAVLTQPIPNGQIGTAQIAGVCLARVNVTDASHRHAAPTASSTNLASKKVGPVELLSPPSGTGLQTMWVKLDHKENFAYATSLPMNLPAGASTRVTLSDGTNVTGTNRSGGTLKAGSAVAIKDLVTGEYMLVGAGTTDETPGGSDKGGIVRVTAATANPSTCLWPGTTVAIAGAPSGACTNPFVPASVCHLLVLNSKGGSWDSTSEDKFRLTVGDHYIGRYVFNIGSTPVYAIRHTCCRGTELYYAELADSLSSTSWEANITSVLSLHDNDDPGFLTAGNLYGLSGAAGASLLCAKYAGSNPDQLFIIQVLHNERTVLESIKLDSLGAPTKIVQVERKIAAMDEGEEPTDADAITLVAETVAVNVKVDSPGAPTKLQQTKKSIRTFPGSGGAADSDIVGIEECES